MIRTSTTDSTSSSIGQKVESTTRSSKYERNHSMADFC